MSRPSSYGQLQAALSSKYDVEGELGRGGMATVYRARDRRHDRNVAIKVLREEVAESLARDRFIRETQLAARLNHPHVLPLYDSGDADGTLYFVMPLMQGQTLRDRLDAEGQLPIDAVLKLATEVADALDYAHRHGVVHRDIKPENILLHEGLAIICEMAASHWRLGNREAAASLYEEVLVRARTCYVGWSEQAAIAASAGRIADARDLLRRGIEARESYLSFESCPAWQPLRDDEEGRRMLDAAGP